MAKDFLSNTGTKNPQGSTKPSDSPFESVSKKVTTLGSRLRVIEERYTNLRKKIQLSDENLLEFEKDLTLEFKNLSSEFLDVKKTISSMNENLINMASELQHVVRQSEFKVIQKYVDIWQPMNFVTREELDKILARHFKK